MPLLISEAEVAELLSMADALALVEEVFSYGGRGPLGARERPATQPRRRVGSGQGTLNVMSASVPARGVFGLKSYPTGPGGANFTVLLYDSDTSELLAIVEAGRLGALRTGAASGVATKHLSREDARTLGLFGAGGQARTQLEAIAAVKPLDRALVYGRDRQRLERFCAEMEDRLLVPVAPASSAEELLGCAIVTTATTSATPLFDGALLQPGTHVNAVGSNFASKAEVDVETVRRSALVVADSVESARLEGGDLLPAIDRGYLSWEHVVELGEVVSGRHPGRTSAEERTLFKSHGVASEDVVLAHEAWRRARERGAGREVPMFGG